jgi:hypothetical protein
VVLLFCLFENKRPVQEGQGGSTAEDRGEGG